ncbi:hypothetical protein GJAV_G00083000 [Gymnothorax javanicus]|nr:hypothetical protein GJAV_G00083000 [Gymnothorax javanicus]
MRTALDEHMQLSSELLLFNVLLILTILTVWLFRKWQIRCMHETGGAMLYGFILGWILRYADRRWNEDAMDISHCKSLNRTLPFQASNLTVHNKRQTHFGMMTFAPEIFFNLFLPPIIFQGAYNLNQRLFFQNSGSVLTFAFLGTVISCTVIGASMYGFVQLMVLLGQARDTDFRLTDCFSFGALISATDPVTVLAIFSELRVDSNLYILLFGESVLNDAVAIVLTYAISTYSESGEHHTFSASAFFLSIGHFIAVFIGSLSIGFIFTIITALISFRNLFIFNLNKFTRLYEFPLLETGLFFLLSWSAFLSAEACGLTGIVSMLFCGITQARYTSYNLSTEAKTRTKQLFEFLNFLGEIFIFCYMGLALFTFQDHDFKGIFISGAFLSIIVARACNIYPLSYLLNLGRRQKIPSNVQHMMVFSGLRGVVAFALAMRDACSVARRTILSTTLLVVCFTVWVLGSGTSSVLSWLNISVGVDPDEDKAVQASDQPSICASQAAGEGTPVSAGSTPDAQIEASHSPGIWRNLDKIYLRPALTHCGPPLTTTLPSWCEPLGKLLTSPLAYENQERLNDAAVDCSSMKLDTAREDGGSTQGDAEMFTEHAHHAQVEDLVEGDLGLGHCAETVWTE